MAAVFVVAIACNVCDSSADAHVGDPMPEMVGAHAEFIARPDAEHNACIDNGSSL